MLERVIARCAGVDAVDVNPVAQTATVTFDPQLVSIAEVREQIVECGYHCAGMCVPSSLCDPMALPGEHEDVQRTAQSAEELMGHGGHAMSMEAMVRDMRNRFLVAAIFSIPVLLWSPIGRDVIGFTVAAPFGLRNDVWSLVLSLPVIFYADWIFFDGAFRALRVGTLDMMVLVAVAVGAGWLYSLAVTLTGGGEVFYEAATVLSAFLLSGTGSRCAPGAEPTMRSGHCSISRRRWRWCCATARRWRYQPPRCRSAIAF